MRALLPNAILFTFLVFMGVSCSFDTIYNIRVRRDGFNSSGGVEGVNGKVMKTKMGTEDPEASALEGHLSTDEHQVK
jgi:hypothetical protein